MSSQENPITTSVDVAALEHLSDLGVLSKVGHLYLENSRSLIDEGRAATARGDLDTVARVFHTLKSSSAMVGATELSDLSALMESVANDKNLKECQELISKTVDSHERTVQDLESYLEQI